MSWKMVPLRAIGTWYGGGTPSKSNPDFWANGTVPWLSPKDMGESTLVRTQDRVTEAAVSLSAVRKVPANSIAMVVRSGILEHSFPSALVPFETTLNQDMKAVVPHDGIDPRWLALGLQAFERDILSTCRKAGTTVASIETKRLQTFDIPVPPLDEQLRILDFLQVQLERLEDAERSLHTSRKKLANGQSEALREFFSHQEGISTVLGRVAAWGSGGTPRSKTPGFYTNGTIPWINSGDLKDAPLFDAPKKITEAGLDASSAKWVPSNSVLVAMYGATIGKTGITGIPVTTNQAVAFAKPILDVITPEYLFWYLRSQARKLAAAGKGGAQPNISQAVLKSWPIQVPPLDRQQDLVGQADDLFRTFNLLDAQLITTQRRVKSLRRSVLYAAFQGRFNAGMPSMSPASLSETPSQALEASQA